MHPAFQAWNGFYQRFRKWQERTREPGLSALLAIEATLLFIVTPFTGAGWLPDFAPPAVYVLFVLATLVVTSRSHLAASLVLFSVILSTVGTIIHADYPSVLTEWLSAGGRLLGISALSVVIAKAVFGPGQVTLHRVQGAIVLYFNFGLFFFTLYQLVHILVADSFAGLPATGSEHGSGAALLYFSFSTLTTAGFGDVKPLYPIARNLANLEAVIGQLFPATLLARLVSLEIAHSRNPKHD
ncbi:MAG TPA: ion channel [Xanthobacteraceae bacterium]|nr:ion channel [Xanthobacteraceae bacterium]